MFASDREVPETRRIVLPGSENRTHDHMFIRLDKTPECDGLTDRQTDRQTGRRTDIL